MSWQLRRNAGLALAVASLPLLLLLAYLQWEWIGEISDGEMARLESRLRNGAQSVAVRLDRELMGAALHFRLPAALESLTADELQGRFDDWWVGSVAGPDLISALTLVRSGRGREIEAVRYDRLTESLSRALPRRSLALISEVRSGAAPLGRFSMRPMVMGEPLTFAMALRPPRGGEGRFFDLVLLELDQKVLVGELIPTLVAEELASDGDLPRWAVFEADTGRRIAPDSDTATGEADLWRDATSQPLFVFSGPPDHRDRFSTRRDAGRSSRPSGRQSRDAARSPATRPIGPSAEIDRDTLSRPASWELRVQPSRGPLPAIVAAARRRNVVLSASILLLAAITIAVLAAARQRSQRLAAQQLAFVSGVTHELQTPLAAIGAAAANLRDGLVGDAEGARRYGRLLERESSRLSALVDQVLRLAAMRQPLRPAQRTPIEVDVLLRDLLAELGDSLRQARIEVELNGPETGAVVEAEPTTLRSAFHSLLSNALKFGGAGRWLGVDIETTASQVRVRIADRGPGIAAPDRDRIFEPFFRGPFSSSNVPGSGVGLTIARSTFEDLGGTLRLDDEWQHGAAFVVELPRRGGS